MTQLSMTESLTNILIKSDCKNCIFTCSGKKILLTNILYPY